ncbi:MAG TPA: PilZ domain-containing protein [Planctomycetota bacterium]|nr:PilZ domain-containing protein [Planctomycetota bacterium]
MNSNSLFTSDFLVKVKTCEGTDASGTILSLDAETVVARFDHPASRLLPIGSETLIAFDGGGLKRRFGTLARVGGWQEGDGFRVYTFAPLQRQEFEDRFVRPFQDGLLRRTSVRVLPEEDNPPVLQTSAEGSDAVTQAKLLDISVGGLRFSVPAYETPKLSTSERFVLKLRALGWDQPITLVGDLRHAHWYADVAIFGMRFDWRACVDGGRAESLLTSYVMELQRAQLATKIAQPAVIG